MQIINGFYEEVFAQSDGQMSNKLEPKTISHYKTSQKYIMKYVAKEYKADNRFLRNLDYKFVIGFENFLRGYRPNHYLGKIENNAVMKHIQRLRRMVNLAQDMEWIDKDPFSKFKAKLEKRQREYLTKEELSQIESTITRRLKNDSFANLGFGAGLKRFANVLFCGKFSFCRLP